jgi:REP element-mobilizing transposase RayT
MDRAKPHANNLRIGRHSQPGHYYFLTTSVVGRRKIFINHDHALIVLSAIRWLHKADRFFVDAAIVMPDHLHIVGQLGEGSRQDAAPTLARVMHSLKSYSARCLSMLDVKTPVWQEGYYDHGLRDDEDYRAGVRYVMQNPIRAGLVRRVEDYPYIILPRWWGDMGE